MDIDSRLNEEKNNGILAIRKAQQIAEQNGISIMSLEEINAEIAKTRKQINDNLGWCP